MLYQMSQANGVTDARVYCMGLDRAFELCRRKPQAQAQRRGKAEGFSMHYRLKPAREALSSAQWRLGPRYHKTMVPLFVARGLEVPRRGLRDARAAFFSLDDLNAAWDSAQQKTGKEASKPTINTYNLVDLVLAADVA
ncbi:hypothetical protein M885DRAFT_536155, partial [Pelagophyceae sp. CCMP2097]